MKFSKDKLVNPQELEMMKRNQQFMDAQNAATDQYMTENQQNPMAFMDVLKGSILPTQEPQIPFAPDVNPRDISSVEETPEVEPVNANQTAQQYNMNIPKADNYSRILNELRAMREKSNADVESARAFDRQSDLADGLLQAGTMIGNAFANKGGYTKIDNKPISVKTNRAADAEKDRVRKIEDLMNEYKILAAKDAKDADRDYKQQMLNLQRDKLDAASKKAGANLTEGQKTLDREFAKEAERYTSSGRVNAISSINKLKEIVKDLKKEGDGLFASGGGRSSALPDSIRSRNSIKWRDNAVTSANATLKELFGAQLSDAEREAAAKEFYNDALSNSENAAILERKIRDLEAGIKNKDAKVDEFFSKGTLSEFKPSFQNQSSQPETKTIGNKTYRKVPGGWEEVE